MPGITDYLKSHSQKQLDEVWKRLAIVNIPLGEYKGEAWSNSFPIGMVNWIWKGKDFSGLYVKNMIFGQKIIRGNVSLSADKKELIIDYPQLHLQDRLRECSPHNMYLGRMNLGKHIVNFTLTKEIE